MNNTKLGTRQERVLAALDKHGAYPGNWVYSTPRETVKILDSLVKRDLVTTFERPVRDMHGKPFPEGHPYHGRTTTYYAIAK